RSWIGAGLASQHRHLKCGADGREVKGISDTPQISPRRKSNLWRYLNMADVNTHKRSDGSFVFVNADSGRVFESTDWKTGRQIAGSREASRRINPTRLPGERTFKDARERMRFNQELHTDESIRGHNT